MDTLRARPMSGSNSQLHIYPPTLCAGRPNDVSIVFAHNGDPCHADLRISDVTSGELLLAASCPIVTYLGEAWHSLSVLLAPRMTGSVLRVSLRLPERSTAVPLPTVTPEAAQEIHTALDASVIRLLANASSAQRHALVAQAYAQDCLPLLRDLEEVLTSLAYDTLQPACGRLHDLMRQRGLLHSLAFLQRWLHLVWGVRLPELLTPPTQLVDQLDQPAQPRAQQPNDAHPAVQPGEPGMQLPGNGPVDSDTHPNASQRTAASARPLSSPSSSSSSSFVFATNATAIAPAAVALGEPQRSPTPLPTAPPPLPAGAPSLPSPSSHASSQLPPLEPAAVQGRGPEGLPRPLQDRSGTPPSPRLPMRASTGASSPPPVPHVEDPPSAGQESGQAPARGLQGQLNTPWLAPHLPGTQLEGTTPTYPSVPSTTLGPHLSSPNSTLMPAASAPTHLPPPSSPPLPSSSSSGPSPPAVIPLLASEQDASSELHSSSQPFDHHSSSSSSVTLTTFIPEYHQVLQQAAGAASLALMMMDPTDALSSSPSGSATPPSSHVAGWLEVMRSSPSSPPTHSSPTSGVAGSSVPQAGGQASSSRSLAAAAGAAAPLTTPMTSAGHSMDAAGGVAGSAEVAALSHKPGHQVTSARLSALGATQPLEAPSPSPFAAATTAAAGQDAACATQEARQQQQQQQQATPTPVAMLVPATPHPFGVAQAAAAAAAATAATAATAVPGDGPGTLAVPHASMAAGCVVPITDTMSCTVSEKSDPEKSSSAAHTSNSSSSSSHASTVGRHQHPRPPRPPRPAAATASSPQTPPPNPSPRTPSQGSRAASAAPTASSGSQAGGGVGQRGLLLDRLSLALDVMSIGLVWWQTTEAARPRALAALLLLELPLLCVYIPLVLHSEVVSSCRHTWVVSARICSQLVLLALVQYQVQQLGLLTTYATAYASDQAAQHGQAWAPLPPQLVEVQLEQLLPSFLIRLVQSRSTRAGAFLVKCVRRPVQLQYSLLPCLVEAGVLAALPWLCGQPGSTWHSVLVELLGLLGAGLLAAAGHELLRQTQRPSSLSLSLRSSSSSSSSSRAALALGGQGHMPATSATSPAITSPRHSPPSSLISQGGGRTRVTALTARPVETSSSSSPGSGPHPASSSSSSPLLMGELPSSLPGGNMSPSSASTSCPATDNSQPSSLVSNS